MGAGHRWGLFIPIDLKSAPQDDTQVAKYLSVDLQMKFCADVM